MWKAWPKVRLPGRRILPQSQWRAGDGRFASLILKFGAGLPIGHVTSYAIFFMLVWIMPALNAQLLVESRLQQTVSPQIILQSEILELDAEALRERVRAELEDNPALEMADDVYFLPTPPRGTQWDHESTEVLDRLCAPYTLADDLRVQLTHVEPSQRPLCCYLIECLDERGFLDADLAEVAGLQQAPVARVREALAALQSLEPAGIGARNLRECLLLQVQRLPAAEVPAHAAEFIEAYLGTERPGTPVQTAGALGLNDEGLARIVKFIGSRLHMWPADKFRDEQHSRPQATEAAFPDAWIIQEGEQLRVLVAQSWSLSLRVSEAYSRLDDNLRRQAAAEGDQQELIAEKVRQARAFIHHLTRREAMLKHVVEAIVERQRDFFSDGTTALQPLTRKELAADLHVHESTISRMSRDKFLRLPNEQLVPLDFFFDASLSAKAVLRSLIEREDPRRPLSDGVLAQRLQAAGYPLARRTVAKYRDHLGIPPAHLRKTRLLLASSE